MFVKTTLWVLRNICLQKLLPGVGQAVGILAYLFSAPPEHLSPDILRYLQNQNKIHQQQMLLVFYLIDRDLLQSHDTDHQLLVTSIKEGAKIFSLALLKHDMKKIQNIDLSSSELRQ